MSPYPLRAVSLCGILTLTVLSGNASAQFFPFSFNCGCPTPQTIPVTSYRTVPVTEYQQVKRIVRRPVYETNWEDREVTAYRPVTESRTVEVPTTVYDNVTEYQTVQRNAGYWTTQIQHRFKPTPCQYDPRPNVFGWLNRTAYSLRAPFIPTAIPRRQYVPNVVTQVVPVVRSVARTEMRKVTYNQTKMVAYKTTQKIAVRTVRYVDQEIVSTQPVTVLRTIPVGTRLTYAYPSYGFVPTQTAWAPVTIRSSTTSQPATRSANSQNNNFGNERSNREAIDFDQEQGTYVPQQKFVPVKSSPEKPSSVLTVKSNTSRTSDSGRLGGWVVQKRTRSNPAETTPEISVANNKFGGWVVRERKTSEPEVTAPEISVANNKFGGWVVQERNPSNPAVTAPGNSVANNK